HNRGLAFVRRGSRNGERNDKHGEAAPMPTVDFETMVADFLALGQNLVHCSTAPRGARPGGNHGLVLSISSGRRRALRRGGHAVVAVGNRATTTSPLRADRPAECR